MFFLHKAALQVLLIWEWTAEYLRYGLDHLNLELSGTGQVPGIMCPH